MKRFVTLIALYVVVVFAASAIKSEIEGLCGNYSLTYSKAKDVFESSDISGIKQSYNMHYNRDLLSNC
jgi:hypothetical protein